MPRERGRERARRAVEHGSTVDALLAELAALYDEVDALSAGWSCPASTECCRFGLTGREPYVTSLELAAVRRARASIGVSAASARRSTRRRLPIASSSDERRCPLLSADGRCTVYAWRPFGCRTFWCDRATPGERIRQSAINDLVRRLKDLACRHEPGGDRGRPLTRAL